VETSGDLGNPTFLNVRRQYGPEYTTSLEVEMWGLWSTLECLDDENVAAGVLICIDSQWALRALKESGHSDHFILSPLRAHLRGLKGSNGSNGSNGSLLIGAISGTKGRMRRPGRLPSLTLLMVFKGGRYPLRWLRA
jgi:hypothetical protein